MRFTSLSCQLPSQRVIAAFVHLRNTIRTQPAPFAKTGKSIKHQTRSREERGEGNLRRESKLPTSSRSRRTIALSSPRLCPANTRSLPLLGTSEHSCPNVGSNREKGERKEASSF
ncbi:hypothetical protein LR48_Vigan07g272200 [Vigna angularis]|uniref:Uncharacterized protein n=2 Tax=Phaseolus angularis TaxID=3914 RepID=A0A0L9V1W7_PHAAN|nr:hypothetical protein LR48_Vigan07g272200 [Vigna angularis]BAT82914.1 hypothetical protein VIGAN_03298600 [Vigna angularis var. angularis]